MDLDQFYTKPDIALKCWQQILNYISPTNVDIFLEPSCGTGSFYNLLPNDKRIGIDLDPKIQDDKIATMNFYDFQPNRNLRYCVVGNPPFGKVSSEAVKFFNKASEFANVIAFVIPRTFRRISVTNRLDLNFHLIFDEDIPLHPCSFEPSMAAKCCFQIWERRPVPRQLVILKTKHPDWKFLPLGAKNSKGQPTPPDGAHFALKAYGSNCGEIVTKKLSTLSPKSWHWIRSNIPVDELMRRFKTLDYSISKQTVRQDSIGAGELVMLYSLKYP